MRWWCAAQGIPWSWSFQPYPGVWLFVAAIALGYGRLWRRTASVGPEGRRERRRCAGRFAIGLLLLWIALDWPVGALGSGYLASVHMVQFLLIALAAPPLLLSGIPEPAFRRLAGRPRLLGVLRILTHPLVALLLFNAVVFTTHWPSVVDGLMASQAGSFALDIGWLLAGLLFWWPLVSPVPERRFPYGLKIGYLLLATVLNTAPYAFLTFGELPFYATFELAPRIGSISAREDQRVAGVLMKVGAGLVLWTAIGVLFYRWYRADESATESATHSR